MVSSASRSFTAALSLLFLLTLKNLNHVFGDDSKSEMSAYQSLVPIDISSVTSILQSSAPCHLDISLVYCRASNGFVQRKSLKFTIYVTPGHFLSHSLLSATFTNNILRCERMIAGLIALTVNFESSVEIDFGRGCIDNINNVCFKSSTKLF